MLMFIVSLAPPTNRLEVRNDASLHNSSAAVVDNFHIYLSNIDF